LSILGGTVGYIIESVNDKSLRNLLHSTGLSSITGPRVYFEYFWALYLILKIFSSYLIYSKTRTFLSIKAKSIQDLTLIVLFFMEYEVIKYIQLLYDFKPSGHCLILTIGSFLIHLEGRLSAKHLKENSIRLLTKFLLALHYYFFICTCIVYHSLPESLSGTVLGLLTLFLVNKLLSS
jgi:hypothetical protein